MIFKSPLMKNGCVVQLDRISDFGSEGWGFESLRGHVKRIKLIFYPFLFLVNEVTLRKSQNLSI